MKGPIGENAGVYVIRFDRDTGNTTLVNYWLDGQNFGAGELDDPAKGQYPTRGYDYYVHDVRVERDPQTGWPIAYVAHLNNGSWVLDVSDPREMRTLGTFDMYRAHEIWPITVADGGGDPRRLFVAGQENPASDWSDDFGSYGQNIDGDTGWLYVVDAQDVDPGDQSEPLDLGAAEEHHDFEAGRETALARWQLSDGVEFENYTLSLHNVEPFEVEIDGRPRQFVAGGHYHAGIRLLEFTEVFRDVAVDYIDNHNDEWPEPQGVADDGMGEVGYFRSHAKGVPDDSKMATLTEATPDFWCAVEENGVLFGSGINTGVYSITLDDPDVPVGDRTPLEVEVDRVADSSIYFGTGTMRVTLSVDTDEPVLIRDRLPRDWDTYGVGDDHRTDDAGDGTLVEFTTAVEPGEHDGHDHDHDGDGSSRERTYFANVQSGGGATVGPVEYSVDGGESWRVVPGTVDSNLVVDN